MASSASSSPPQADTRLNFNALVSSSSSRQLKHQAFLSFGGEDSFMTPSSSSSARPVKKHHVFLSFRGGDKRLNFSALLLEALKEKGVSVLFN
ncbi:hypothetical protein V6N13_038459 [Hibiscus sabdariffa]